MWYLLVVENIEVKVREVTIREMFDGGEILIEELGIAIPKCYQETSGIVEEFGTLAFKRIATHCWWKLVQEILASEASVNGGPGLGLVDTDKRIHITTHDEVAAPEHCQKNLRWFTTAEEKIRVVGKVSARGDQLQDFEQLMGEEVLYFASMNLKLEYSM